MDLEQQTYLEILHWRKIQFKLRDFKQSLQENKKNMHKASWIVWIFLYKLIWLFLLVLGIFAALLPYFFVTDFNVFNLKELLWD